MRFKEIAGTINAAILTINSKVSLPKSCIEIQDEKTNKKLALMSVPAIEKIKAVEKNFERSACSFLSSEVYLTTPLKTPKVDVLVRIAMRFLS